MLELYKSLPRFLLWHRAGVSSGLLDTASDRSSPASASFISPTKAATITLSHLLGSQSNPMNNIHGEKQRYLSEENRYHTRSIREQPNPERSLLHSIWFCSSAIDSAHFFFHWHWIKSKSCSLWNEVGLVRAFKIQSQHSRDFQVSSMPKSPSILRNLGRTDNLSVPRATLLHLSRISEWLQGVGVDPDPQAVWSVWALERCQSFYMRFPDQTTANLHGRWAEVHARHTDLWTTKQEIACSVELVFPCY